MLGTDVLAIVVEEYTKERKRRNLRPLTKRGNGQNLFAKNSALSRALPQ